MNKLLIPLALATLFVPPLLADVDETIEPIDLSGLEPVSESRLDDAFIRSGIALDQYRAVTIKAPEVSFRAHWQRDQNHRRDGERIREQDMDRIRERVSGQLVSILTSEFTNQGHVVVEAPAPGVLIVDVRITDLDVVGPEPFPATQVQTFSEYSGSMTLEVQLRDDTSNKLLVWSRDRQREISRGYLQSRTRVTNNRDSRLMIEHWVRELFDTLNRA